MASISPTKQEQSDDDNKKAYFVDSIDRAEDEDQTLAIDIKVLLANACCGRTQHGNRLRSG